MADKSLKRHERGLSLIGLLIFGIIAVMLVVVGMRVLPTVLEYMAIERALTKLAGSGNASPAQIKSGFDRIAAVDDIASITGRDLIIERTPAGVLVSFQYEKRVPLYGSASLLLDYRGRKVIGDTSR
jgi:hypothetical protein